MTDKFKILIIILSCIIYQFLAANAFSECVEGDCINDRGTFISKDGNIYMGEFKDGSITGKGVVTYQDGRKLEGEFKDGVINGKGTITYSDGKKIECDFVNGEAQNTGLITYPDGNVKKARIKKSNNDLTR